MRSPACVHRRRRTPLPRPASGWGRSPLRLCLFTGTFEPKEGGEYLFVTTCRETAARLDTRLTIQGLARERIGQPARYDVLDEIARITRGRMASVHDVKDIMQEVADLPEPDPVVRRVRIWSHPAWGGVIVLLLGVFWTGRKLVGVV